VGPRMSGHGGEEKKSLHCPCLELNPGSPIHSLVTILAELPWRLEVLSYTILFSWLIELRHLTLLPYLKSRVISSIPAN
jgi:hypothetical protein